jgi:cation transport ATPase
MSLDNTILTTTRPRKRYPPTYPPCIIPKSPSYTIDFLLVDLFMIPSYVHVLLGVAGNKHAFLYLFSSTPCILHIVILGQMFIGNMPTWHASAYRRSERRQMASMVIMRVSLGTGSAIVLYTHYFMSISLCHFPLFQVMT